MTRDERLKQIDTIVAQLQQALQVRPDLSFGLLMVEATGMPDLTYEVHDEEVRARLLGIIAMAPLIVPAVHIRRSETAFRISGCIKDAWLHLPDQTLTSVIALALTYTDYRFLAELSDEDVVQALQGFSMEDEHAV